MMLKLLFFTCLCAVFARNLNDREVISTFDGKTDFKSDIRRNDTFINKNETTSGRQEVKNKPVTHTHTQKETTIEPFTSKPREDEYIEAGKVIDQAIKEFGPKSTLKPQIMTFEENTREHSNVEKSDKLHTSPRTFKSERDNEVSKPSSEDRWIWNDSSTKATVVTPDVGDRAAFTGDKCPTGKVKFNNKCVDVD